MNRVIGWHLLGVLVLLVGVPLVLREGAGRYPLLRHLRPTVSLSMVRDEAPVAPKLVAEPPPPAAPVLPPQRVIIVPLPPPEVTVALENINTDERARFHIGVGGQLRPEEAAQVRHFFRCKRTWREKTLAPGVLALLAEVAQRWPGHTIEVISGFRAPPFGAPHSKHFVGHAIDLRVRGVRSALVRDGIWRDHHGVGVGHYPSENFVHLDWRPGEPDTAWTGAGEDGINSYSPRWAWRARHLKRPPSPLAAAAVTATRSL
jgi:uncharacterized protein YcbK (DUF882 family)